MSTNLVSFLILTAFCGLSTATTLPVGGHPAPNTVNYPWKEPKKEEAPKSFGLSILVGQTAGLYDKNDGTREKSSDLELSTKYELRKATNLSAVIAGSIDQNDSENNDIGKAVLGFSQGGFDLFSSSTHQKLFSLSGSFSTSLPVSKAQRDQSFQAGITPGFGLKLEEGLLPSKRVSASLGLKFTRNFFVYDQAINGTTNTQYSSSQTLALGYELPADFSLSLSLAHFNSWTFRGQAGEAFSHTEAVAYKVSQSFETELGHQFGNPVASLYKSDGQTSNLNLANETDSYVYANITYTY